jgi:hypothetical protein
MKKNFVINGIFPKGLSNKNIEKILNKFKIQHKEIINEEQIKTIILQYIKNNNLVFYGGYAIHLLLQDKRNEGIYNEQTDLLDFDVYSVDPVKDANELSELLRVKGFKNIRIISGMTGHTRKIFINLSKDAIIDISLQTKEILDKIKIKIGDYFITDPQYMKIDHYMQLTMNFLQFHWRIKKTFKRILLLEKYFPILNNQRYEEPKISNGTIKSIEKINKTFIIVVGGDYVFNKLFNLPQTGELHIFSNEINDTHIPIDGVKIKKDIRLFPIIGQIFYNDVDNYKQLSISGLIYTYYVLKFYENTNKHDYKIKLLLNKFLNNPFAKLPNIYTPEYPYLKKDEKLHLKSRYLTAI